MEGRQGVALTPVPKPNREKGIFRTFNILSIWISEYAVVVGQMSRIFRKDI